MQAVGGVKGGQYWSLSTIYEHVSKAIELAVQQPVLTDEELKRLKELAPVPLQEFSLRLGLNGAGAGVNFRDLCYIPQDSDSNKDSEEDSNSNKEDEEKEAKVPAQFIYEPADCRRFVTAEMLFRPARMWEVAREVMFGDGDEYGRCVG